MRTAVVRHKRRHPQIFAHRMPMEVQTPDDVCLCFPLCGQFMHLVMHRHLPGPPRAGCGGLPPRRFSPLTSRLDRPRWSQGRLLGVLFHPLACLTEHVDLLCQRFLDHFSQVFEHMPAIEDLLDVRGAFCGGFPITGASVTTDHLDSSMPV